MMHFVPRASMSESLPMRKGLSGEYWSRETSRRMAKISEVKPIVTDGLEQDPRDKLIIAVVLDDI